MNINKYLEHFITYNKLSPELREQIINDWRSGTHFKRERIIYYLYNHLYHIGTTGIEYRIDYPQWITPSKDGEINNLKFYYCYSELYYEQVIKYLHRSDYVSLKPYKTINCDSFQGNFTKELNYLVKLLKLINQNLNCPLWSLNPNPLGNILPFHLIEPIILEHEIIQNLRIALNNIFRFTGTNTNPEDEDKDLSPNKIYLERLLDNNIVAQSLNRLDLYTWYRVLTPGSNEQNFRNRALSCSLFATSSAKKNLNNLYLRTYFMIEYLIQNRGITNLILLDGHGRLIWCIVDIILNLGYGYDSLDNLTINIIDNSYYAHMWHRYFLPSSNCTPILSDIYGYIQDRIETRTINSENTLIYLNFCGIGGKIGMINFINFKRQYPEYKIILSSTWPDTLIRHNDSEHNNINERFNQLEGYKLCHWRHLIPDQGNETINANSLRFETVYFIDLGFIRGTIAEDWFGRDCGDRSRFRINSNYRTPYGVATPYFLAIPLPSPLPSPLPPLITPTLPQMPPPNL